MKVNLDQIEFYCGPGRPPPPSSAQSVLPGHTSAHVPPCFQHSFPARLGCRAGPFRVPVGESPPLTGATHEWNMFDFEINNVDGSTWPKMAEDVQPAVTTNMPAACDILLDHGSSVLALSEPVPLTDSAKTIPCHAEPDHLAHISSDVLGNDLPDAVPVTRDMETSPLSSMPCVTAPIPVTEQASDVFKDLSMVGVSEQESPKQKLSITMPSVSLRPWDCENDADSSQTSDLGENPCSRANDVTERAKDSGTTEDRPVPSRPSAPPTVRSSSECSRIRTTRSSDLPMRCPSIAVVVPPSSWKQGAARKSTRAAAAVCKKRLRSGRGSGSHQDGNTTFYETEQPCQKKKKRRHSARSFTNSSDSSIPVSSHFSGAIQGVRGSALLTVESKPGLKPAYFFTFVPEPSPMPYRPDMAAFPGKLRPYTSDENALLVRLKEKEAMSWSEITTHFPDRNISSLQVHYSTKLRHKAHNRSGKPRRSE